MLPASVQLRPYSGLQNSSRRCPSPAKPNRDTQILGGKKQAQCDKVEHFDCVNANDFMVENVQKGFIHYYCTECLTNNPVLGLEVIMDSSDVQGDEQRSIAIENNHCNQR